MNCVGKGRNPTTISGTVACSMLGVFCAVCAAGCSEGAVTNESIAHVSQGIGGAGGMGTTFIAQTGADTQLVENDSTNYATRDRISVRGDGPGTAAVMVGLLKWNVAMPAGGAPGNCNVASASITLNVVSTSSQSFKLYPANRAWTDSQANWTDATSTNAWQTPGAMGAADRGAAFKEFTPSTAGPLLLSLDSAGIALVQSWLGSFGSNNRGIVIGHETHSDGASFASFDHATFASRPKLSFTCQ